MEMPRTEVTTLDVNAVNVTYSTQLWAISIYAAATKVWLSGDIIPLRARNREPRKDLRQKGMVLYNLASCDRPVNPWCYIHNALSK